MDLLARSSDPTDWGQIDAPGIHKVRRRFGMSSAHGRFGLGERPNAKVQARVMAPEPDRAIVDSRRSRMRP